MPDAAPTKPLIVLDYVERPPWHRRRTARRIINIALALVVGIVIWRFAPVAWWQMRVLYWQHRCFEYGKTNPQIVSLSLDPSKPPSGPQKDWAELYALLSPPGSAAYATLFVGELKSPNGTSRLVAIDLSYAAFSDGVYCEINGSVIAPATSFGAPQVLMPSLPISSRLILVRDTKIQSARDPANSSHILIEMTGEGAEMIDAWLEDDSRVAFELRASSSESTLKPDYSVETSPR